jgi:hypothetical protein
VVCVSKVFLSFFLVFPLATAQIRLPNQAIAPAEAQEGAPALVEARKGNGPWTIEVPGSPKWVDTGIDLQPGDTLKAEASGTITRNGKPNGPEGSSRGWTDMIKAYPVADGNPGALIGKIGTSVAARAFLIGEKRESPSPIAGRLFLSVNFSNMDAADGAFKVKISRKAGKATVSREYAGPRFTQELLDQVPRRVQDAQGTLGDRTNFIIVGTEKQVVEAFKNAGWVQVDRTAKESFVKGVFSSLSKQAYVTIPMSELILFDRVQDFGFAQADPIQVVAARHHFRLWKAPFTLDGRTVWVGAGTHDVGFDKDQRNGKITHKIDPNVDGEREYIGESLKTTGLVVATEYLTPVNPITEAKTAHGQDWQSDGRTLIIYFVADTEQQAKAR